ncbi:unannotated protein [freshwater metagenome]|uniref:Unannotated protein n=1 Tax=freshwater metagenome TaxID=449393 RepID=A0A6J6FS40_9ZZZZ
MERFVAVTKTLQDVDRVGHGRLVNRHGLESAFKRRILLEVLAVLVESCRTNGLEFTAGEHRLEDARGVDCALRRTCANECVDFVDEDDDVSAVADLLRDLLEALFEVTAVSATGNKASEVECVDLLALDGLRHFTLDDRLGETFDNGCLSDTRFANEHGVVLGSAGEDLHDAFHLFFAADDGVEFSVARSLREVAAELVEDL